MKKTLAILLFIVFVSIGIASAAGYYAPDVSRWQSIVNLFGSGSCSGYLKSDGTCATSASTVTGLTLGTNATLTVSDSVNVTIANSLGSAAYLDVGTNANQVVQLDGTGKYPAADGSLITNLDVAHISGVTSWDTPSVSSGVPIIASSNSGKVVTATFQIQGTINATYNLDQLGGATNITYADLMTAVGANALKEASFYRITDFATVYYISDSAGTQYEAKTSTAEPIVVFATSANTLDKQAFSATYPQDIIYYDPNPNNWLSDIGFAQNATIVNGFKGVIYFRHDTKQDNYMGYDFRNVLFRRWALDVSAYNAETTYAKDDYAYDDTGKLIYRSLQDANIGNYMSDAVWWAPYATVSATKYLSPSPNADMVNLIPVDAEDYEDFLTFAQLTTNGTYEACAYGNHFASYKPAAPVSTILANNVLFMSEDAFNVPTKISDNVFTGTTAYNTYNPGTSTSSLSDNKIGSYCLYNLFGAGSTQYNDLKYIAYNTFAGSFLWNVADVGLSGCIFPDGFTRTRIGTGVSMINFVTATKVTDGTFDKEIFTIEGGTVKLRYYDSTGSLVVTDPTI